jgi:2-hydroxychromene-2-carboxylate isomerase
VKFDYVSVLVGGIYKSTGNMSPFDSLRGVKNRPEYQALETPRFLRRRKEAAQFHLMQQVLKN